MITVALDAQALAQAIGVRRANDAGDKVRTQAASAAVIAGDVAAAASLATAVGGLPQGRLDGPPFPVA